MKYTFKTIDHPTANDRTPVVGDEAFKLWFPTDNGGTLVIEMGRSAMIHTAGCVLAMMRDDPEMRELCEAEARLILDAPIEHREAM